jgi:acyl-CoA dehydrogenase
MDFAYDARTEELRGQLQAFIDEHILPAEPIFEEQAAKLAGEGRGWERPPIMDELKVKAQRRGLWNLFLAHHPAGPGLTNLQYAPLAELSGRSFLTPEALNCAAPDTGNMEVLAMFGTPEQQQRWLVPLLEGRIRSCFSMTEPDVASSDATNIDARITRDGDEYVINGRKWWSTGALRPECQIAIVMGVTDPGAERHARHSMILVPLDTPGVTVQGSTSVFGYDDAAHGGHGEITFVSVRVPAHNLIGQPGSGFAIAQARLGPGRIHHCMRAIGMGERALELMTSRVLERTAFGQPLARQGVIREWIAESRLALDQARLLVLKTAWLIDHCGVKNAASEIAAIKVAAPRAASYVLDRAIQAHGGAGVSADTPLAAMWAAVRTLHLADGPDEVHLRSIARLELGRARERLRG